ncbi:MAG: DUF2989 domain-containing protein [Psychrosphaera sp.]|nr:DUF2989 domain-containing protein [Psychrosphaera sp.]
MKSITLAVVAALLLPGCEEPLTLRQICDEKAKLCTGLGDSNDGHCKNERVAVIFNRYYEAKLPSDKNRYKLLMKVEKYSKCMALASQIEHIKLKGKQTVRVEGYLTSLKDIKRLSDVTVLSDYPPLLYYHWTRNSSKKALTKFLRLEGSKELNTPELTYGLATYYIKRDLPKTIQLLYKTLGLYKTGEPVNQEIYISLSSIFFKQDKFSSAYLWAKISTLAGAENVHLEELRFKIANQGKTTGALDNLAEDTYSSILQGKFVEPK